MAILAKEGVTLDPTAKEHIWSALTSLASSTTPGHLCQLTPFAIVAEYNYLVVCCNYIRKRLLKAGTVPSLVEEIRAMSRTMVRELGFMGGDFAGTDLSPSAVHALIEIEKGGSINARDLGTCLRLEKSSVSRMLRKLVDSGDVKVQAGEGDGRVKLLSLTAAGKKRVVAIHAFARAQFLKRLVA